MLINRSQIQLRQDQDGVWIASSPLLPGCHADGQSELDAVLNFEDIAISHLEALKDSGRRRLKTNNTGVSPVN